MMRSLVQRAALVGGVALGLIGTAPKTANAQKALVYCPVSVDATGCNAIVSALTGPAYPLGVDRGYDGTGGTVDLKAVDLFAYSVFIVPSLADGPTSQPYAMLRDPEVVEHLKAALIGRIAMWSGSPDQGATNRAMKDALIQNLAGWAGGAFGAAKGPGLVALLDASSNAVTRYDWVRPITPVPLTSDGALLIYNSVRALNARATTILTSGAGPIVYDNMATFGFQVPNGAAGVTLDAVGQTGTSQGGQVVLLTMEAGNASGATVKTDKDDYGPGETVTIAGGGWQAGEEVKLSLHMDPLRDADTELSATADGNGNITNTDFSPATYDIGVRFVLTAVGQRSGRRAQATFTDGNKITFSTTAAGAEATTFGTVTIGACIPAFVQERTGANIDNGSHASRAVTLSASPATISFHANSGCSGGPNLITSVTIPTNQPAVAFWFKVNSGSGTFTLTGDGAGLGASSDASATVDVDATVATTLTLSAPTPASVTYGSTGLVSLSATLTRTSGGAAVSGATVAFTVDAVNVGSATTNGSGVATVSYNPSTLNVASHTVASSFAGATLSATTYIASTSGNQTLAVTQRTVTPNITAGSKTYDGTTAATILTRTLTGVLAGDVGNVTLTGGTGTFDTKNIGTAKTVTATGLSITGTAAANYLLDPTTATTSANITAASVSVLITAASKVYDGTTTASILTRTPSGVIAGETVTVTGGTATFDTKNVGTGKTVTGTGFVLGGADAGNYVISPATAICTADISALGITGTFTASNKVYDGTTSATILTRSLTGLIAPDVASLTSGTAAFDNKNVGTGKTVTLSGASLAGADAGNYTLLSVGTTTANITTLAITGSITASNKEYDGTTAASILTRTLTGQISGDAVTYTGGSATFDTKNVGTGKTVTATGLSLTGSDAGNYTVDPSAITTADITAKALTGSITAANRVYDGNTSATILTRTVVGVLAGETVTYNGGTATFDTKSVGTSKTVTATGLTLGGSDAGNYTVNATAATTADITTLGITGSFTAADKAYDGNTSATVDTRSLTGVIAPDVVSLNGGTATFDTKNVGANKTVTLASATLAGADAGNYSLSSVATTTADITPLAITGSITASSKVYDGTTAATILTRTLLGQIAGDNVSYSGGSATFDTEDVGSGKTVTATGLTLNGADAGNYTVNASATTTANITPKALVGSVTASNKVYDGNTTASIATRSLSGVVGTDVVTYVGGAATFADKNVANGKTVTATGLALSGADAGNYTVNTTATTTADITALGITGNFTASSKVYDGTTSATVLTRTLNSVIAPDVVSLTGGTATFGNKNVGTGKTVTLTGASLAGGDAGNYSLASVGTATADITTLGITGSITAANKVYDGNTSASIVTRTLAGQVVTDDISYSGGTATFSDKTVANGKTVTATGLGLSGTDAGNYTVNTTATTTANITALAITGSITADNKIYNANTSATILTRTLAGVIAGDAVSYVGGTATFADKNVGTGKTVTGTGLSLNGIDAGNYTVNASATTTANITQLAIIGSITANNKVYDGNTSAVIATRTLAGVIAGDAVSYTGGAATFADKNVGVGKTVTGTGLGLTGGDAGNYSVNTTAATTASITQATPTINWANPASIVWPAALTSTQLNATVVGVASEVPTGSFNYTPPATTVLTPGVQSLAVVFTSTDPNYTNANKSVSITVLDQTKPLVSGTVVTPNPVALGAASVTLNGTISDLTTGGSNITSACYRIDGGATCTPVAAFTPAVTVNVTATVPLPNVADVLELCLYGTDASSNTSVKMDCVLVAVYDPNGGFVTGGGWIDSPAGAYVASPSLTGKATFGFVSKFKRGQTTPDGSTEFQFQAAGFNFKSTSYEWLVVSGAKAQYKGSGTINGSGDYFFMLTATDMDLKGKPNADTFRFKVWNKTTLTVIYDNLIGVPDTADPTTLLGAGSIQIHEK
jgi:trimeric autotransporter adhesin